MHKGSKDQTNKGYLRKLSCISIHVLILTYITTIRAFSQITNTKESPFYHFASAVTSNDSLIIQRSTIPFQQCQGRGGAGGAMEYLTVLSGLSSLTHSLLMLSLVFLNHFNHFSKVRYNLSRNIQLMDEAQISAELSRVTVKNKKHQHFYWLPSEK